MKLNDKLAKISDSLTIYLYDNGFMVEVSGRDDNDDWKTAKIMCNTITEVTDLIQEAESLPRD